jgi:hypothetical protein
VRWWEEMKLHNIKMNMKADPMYKNFRHDITPEGLALAFRWIPDATGLSEVDKELIVLKAREDMEDIWPRAKDETEAMALFQEKTRNIKDPEKLKIYLCEFLLDLAILASTWIEAQEKAGMNASAQRMFG